MNRIVNTKYVELVLKIYPLDFRLVQQFWKTGRFYDPTIAPLHISSGKIYSHIRHVQVIFI